MPRDRDVLTPQTAKVCCVATIRDYLKWREECLGPDKRKPDPDYRVALHCSDCKNSCVATGGVWLGTI